MSEDRSHIGIIRPVAALGRGPHDVLRRILDVAGLAVDAVLEVDHEARLLALFLHELVNTGRAVAGRGAGVFGQVVQNGDVRVLEFEMRRLVLFVVRHREGDVGQPVEAELAVGLGVLDRGVILGDLGRFRIRLAMLERAQQGKAQGVGPHVEAADRQGCGEAVLGPERLDVAHLLEVLADGARPDLLLVVVQLVPRPPGLDRLVRRFGGGLARQHGVVVALDPRHVDHPDRTSKQGDARGDHLRHRLVPALRDRARAIGDPLAALEQLGHDRVVLEALEFHVGEDVGILVVQVDDEADQHLIVFEVIDERPAAGVGAERPAHGVGHRPLLVLGGVDLPDLLHAEAVFLRLLAIGEAVFLDHLLREGPAHAFAQEDVFAMQFHAGLIARAFGAVGVPAEFACDHALDGAVLAVDDFRTGHAGENLDAQFLGLFRHPAADVPHRDDVVAVVGHQRRHGEIGHPQTSRFAQDKEIVVLDRHVQRRALFLPVGYQGRQPAGVQYGTRQDMRPDLGPLFQHDDLEIGVELFQTDGGAQASGTGAHDDNVVFHRLALNFGHGVSSPPGGRLRNKVSQ
ncbi:hypothetical protein OB2597_09924 [Pseudooceanicola batsensis HTCC2597]|uniref:Uncharacterized protein n=1 Tax=Pseudooceanicola batsensis (strain ATCC BAA-863 / DSM 15984 / KCTC 12145 / HTCC2597) TaxID=252305 RepID=A3TVA7_PSEBH|nr:hypothetical protein OB2597_09924 [Pseudooceanicola batsensis HTCC2597]